MGLGKQAASRAGEGARGIAGRGKGEGGRVCGEGRLHRGQERGRGLSQGGKRARAAEFEGKAGYVAGRG